MPRRSSFLSSLCWQAAACLVLLTPVAEGWAQEVKLNGLGWIGSAPGTALEGQTRLWVQGNRAEHQIQAFGIASGFGLGVLSRNSLIATVQVNSLGFGSATVRGGEVLVGANRLTDRVEAVGGAATANSFLMSGGDARHEYRNSFSSLTDNRAGQVRAVGAEADALLGAIAAFQLPGRASANSVLLNETHARHLQTRLHTNVAEDLQTVGGASLGNAVTSVHSNLERSDLTLIENEAQKIYSGGGLAQVGAGLLISGELNGASMANSVAITHSHLQQGSVLLLENHADDLSGLGGSALANSLNLIGSSDVELESQQIENQATQVSATGAQGSVMRGAIAEVEMSAVAMANSISITEPIAGSHHEQLLLRNHTEGVHAAGGGAAANSIWAQRAHVQGSAVVLRDNRAVDIHVTGGSAKLGGGLMAEFSAQGRSLANSVVLGEGASVQDSPVMVSENQAREIGAAGGLSVANSLVVDTDSSLSSAPVLIHDNQADDVQATGFNGSAGKGLIAAASQKSSAIANSVVLLASDLRDRIVLMGNRARHLASHGGSILANAIGVERGEGRAAHLGGAVVLRDNQADTLSSGARSTAGPGRVFGSEMDARTAANSLVLHDGANFSASSQLELSGNQAFELQAIGGTVLVNSLAAYRDARIDSTSFHLDSNLARHVAAGGGYAQAVGVGKNSNGIVAVNSVYLDGGTAGPAQMIDSVVNLKNNQAAQVTAEGGRINANALAINGQGRVSGLNFTALNNQVDRVSSEGKEGTVAGRAVIGRGVGHANANAVQTFGELKDTQVLLQDNHANDVHASKGLASANSVVIADSDGRLSRSGVQIKSNRSQVRDSGAASSVVISAQGKVSNSQISIINNTAKAAKEGVASSVINEGHIANSNITILGNQVEADRQGLIASVRNSRKGRIDGAAIYIVDNQGIAEKNGVAHSVDNHGQLSGKISIIGNRGAVGSKGTLNSVVNQGRLSGRVAISNNRGSASSGGVANSVINKGRLSGQVTIANNNGHAGGGTVNSLINRGTVTGRVSIVGNSASAGWGRTSSSVRVSTASRLSGSAGVSHGVTHVSNPNLQRTKTRVSPVVRRTVTINPTRNVRNL